MLHLCDICLQLGGFKMNHLNLHIRKAEYCVILGPTGTGKTVLLETIVGLNNPQQGKIILDKKDITKITPEKRHLGVVYQDYALFPHLNVFDNIGFGMRLQGMPHRNIRTKVHEMAEFLRISHLLNRHPGNLSGGECQRTALARALVMHPKMLLLDEPLSAVDRLTRDRLQSELKRIHKELNITILHITHDLNEAFFLADRIAVMRDGTILQQGDPEVISRQPVNRFVAELMGIKNFLQARVNSNGSVQIPSMGSLEQDILPTLPPHEFRTILVTFPDWAVEVTSIQKKHHWWHGKTVIAALHPGNNHIGLDLTLPSGTSIHTSFSQREIQQLPEQPTQGSEVYVGINRNSLHWLPHD